MWIEKLKKIISGALIFFLLFSITLHVPFLQYFSTPAFAQEKEFYNLVSLIVDQDTYDSIKVQLRDYSQDIQAKLENTQVVIFPTPSDASVLDIASLNESLYLEGYKSVKKDIDFDSRLVGTVLIGKIPVPIVFDGENSGRSILPYVDFEKKAYIFNHENGKYEKSDAADTELAPEIWHGVISPNTGDTAKDIQALKDFFKKDHDYYTGQGVFAQEKGVIDGKDTVAPVDYEPQVFYYDQFKENKALQYQKYVGYQMYLQNIEDITYKRYSKELAEKIKNQVLGNQNEQIQDLLRKVDPSFDMSLFSGGLDVNSSSDVLTRYITDNATNKYLEIFNSSALGDIRKYVYNAGRYNESGSKINLDMPPFLISILDQISAEVIKNVNTSLEKDITDVVANGLSRKIPIVLEYKDINGPITCSQTYTGFFYGTASENIKNAAQCSIYRGSTASGTLVEANRGYNVNLTEADIALCQGDFSRGDTNSEGVSKGYWGGNTPLNFVAPTNGNYSNLSLKNNNLKGGIRPVYDILGSKEISDSTKIPSPLDCFSDGILLQTYDEKSVSHRGSDGESEQRCELNFQAPVLGKNRSGTWSCRTVNNSTTITDFPTLFQQNYNSVGACAVENYTLGSLNFSKKGPKACTSGGESDTAVCCPVSESTSFKAISSYILHTSPTNEEFGAQTQSLFTPSLPIDKNRYIDFIGAKGGVAPDYGYAKIDFPQLFRVTLDAGQELTLENIAQKVKEHLDATSDHMNQVIRNSDPTTLSSAADKALYQELKTGNYPSANIDLYKMLNDKSLEVFTLNNESKQISYYDTLVFAVFWNNLTTISSKYKFIFENYLSNQFEGNDFKFALPKSKKSYETAYLAAPGDAANMYIKLDPQEKADHPYADILSQNLALQSTLLTGNIPDPMDYEDTFKCGPPDGVPIWQWIPAVICWLKDMLPPKIKISQGSCGYDTLFLNEEERQEILACEGDVNKNGLNDCLEGKLVGGSLSLESDANRYFYNSAGVLYSQIKDAQGDVVTFDTMSLIKNSLARVEIPKDPTLPFSAGNIEVVYDSSIEELSTDDAITDAQKYINFTQVEQRAFEGESKTYFSTKATDANIYFKASVEAHDVSNALVIDLKSPLKKIEIRGDQLFMNSYVIENDGSFTSNNTMHAAATQNLFLVDGTGKKIEDVLSTVQGASPASEKLLWMIGNYSRAGNVLPLDYPLSVSLLLDGEKVFEESSISKETISEGYPFFTAQESGRYEIKLRDATGFETVQSFDIISGKAKTLNPQLSTTIVETGGNITTHLVTLEDEFGNPANGEVSTIDISIEGNGLIFDTNGEKTLSAQVVEGYKAFRLKSTNKADDNTLTFTLKDISGKTITQKQVHIQTLDKIALRIVAQNGTPQVGNKTYKYNLFFNDTEGKLLTGLNSRVYLTLPKLYGSVSQSYVSVIGGKAEVSFTTSTLAGEKVPLEIQLEGGNSIYKSSVDINPEAPIKINLSLSKDKIEAAPEATSILEAVLKDRYNNDVFTNNDIVFKAQVHDLSKNIISFDAAEKKVSRGKAQFQISGTDIPGIAYFKVSSIPDISQNSFDIVGQYPFLKADLTLSGFTKTDGSLSTIGKQFFTTFGDKNYLSKFSTQSSLLQSEAYQNLASGLQTQLLDFWNIHNTMSVSGVGQNAGSIETFFFWGKEDIVGNSYNGLYTVLAGAPYGDIAQENYLAGSLLFDPKNTALAVTSLLNVPYVFHDVLQIEQNGFLRKNTSTDITQDIQFRPDIDAQGRLIVDTYNDALGTYIGRIYYNIDTNSDISLGLESENSLYNLSSQGENVFVKNAAGQVLFEAYESGRFQRRSGTFMVVDESYKGPGIKLILKNGEDSVAHMLISGNFQTNITRDAGLLENKLTTLSNTLIFHLNASQYSSRDIKSNDTHTITSIYYQDPFAARYTLDDFHNTGRIGLESTQEESGIGWQESNTMLLNFSAGSSVGESNKDFQSFSLINLGDPVLSLKPLSRSFPTGSEVKSFDPTVGEMIEADSNMIAFQTFDYNKDETKDILTIGKDGYLKIFQNTPVDGKFVLHGNLVYAADGGAARMVKTGDFTGDGYDDIFFVTDKGKPALFNNIQKDFTRLDLSDQISLSGAIIQAESYDMDADGKDDIVTLDDAGQIHIFYGSGTAENPTFTKKFIGDGYAIELDGEAISHGGAVYFDGLTQIDRSKAEALLQSSEQYTQALSGALLTGGTTPVPQFIDESLVDSFLYVTLPYIPTKDLSTQTSQQILMQDFGVSMSGVGGSAEGESLTGVVDDLGNFLDQYGSYVQYSGYTSTGSTLNGRNGVSASNSTSQTYFLRSQYADLEGIKVSKKFSETSPPFLQTGDIVYFDISLKNTTSKTLKNVAYVDSIPAYFRFANNTMILVSEDNKEVPRSPGIAEYNILIDHLNLAPGEEANVRLELQTLPLSYGYLQVGLYESGEVGDDIFGDILLKKDEENCGKEADIFRSTAIRSYQKGVTEPTCESDALDIGNTFPELTDTDNNGIPDYLQTLISPSVSDEAVQDYADQALEELGVDSDGDSIPDADDTMDNTDSATDFMGALDKINGAIDEISENIDELVQGLSCGFGGGSCFANPLNWAPLAPGSAPTLMGMPLGPLTPNTGIPVFSALTGRQASCGFSPCCLPSVWPASSAAFIPGPFCGPSSAGGSRGTWASTNFVRVFATPTLTGGAGIAVCFGGPAIAAGNANPMGVHPIVPGGNCIVAAMPLFGCEGGEGDPGVLGYPFPGKDLDVIHANCDGNSSPLATPQSLNDAFVQDYLEYLRTGVKPRGLYDQYVTEFTRISDEGSGNFYLPTQPLINIGNSESSELMSMSVDLDTSALAAGNFQDVIQVQNKRVGAFPNFLMDWVERQLDEITSKLTNLPKLFVVLPDFGGIFDFSWKNFGTDLKNTSENNATVAQNERDNKTAQLSALEAAKSNLNCSGSDRLQCQSLDFQIASVSGTQRGTGKETLSGIKEAYDFLGNIPLVNIETETININVPWVDTTELNRFSVDWKYTLEQWKGELANAKNSWSLGAACDQPTQAEKDRCQQENSVKQKAYADTDAFIKSLETNIEILEEYKEFPKRLAELINIKEVWLEQILCNIEAIASLLGEWIGTNGKRFKAWVELIVLIKAVLKSWQLLLDVFNGYEEECHECKNERQDLQNFIFRLISAIIPSPPIIQFPKWPDIILDLHNIRAGMTIYMPDFQINMRPIVLPTLPELHLPAVPTAGFTLPALPTLPRFTIPELPELPTLPSVDLPDLPPPPKIPALFGAVEGILNIMKLVTKVMCILKSSPFVPEWRAGDQIAFLTERNGYLPMDFIDIQPPAFSYSAITAIKISTYVNLEFETEFIIEAIRAITAPLDKATNNIVHMFDQQITDISLVDTVPTDINIKIDQNGETIPEISFAPLDKNPEGIYIIAGMLARKLENLIVYLSEHNNDMLDNTQFQAYVQKQLASSTVTQEPRTQELQKLWQDVHDLTYSKEDTFIQELQKNSTEKFDTLKDIISSEIEYTKQQQQEIKNLGKPSIYTQVVNTQNDSSRFTGYKELLAPYNSKMLDASLQLISGQSKETQDQNTQIQKDGAKLTNSIRVGLQAYKDAALLTADTSAPSISAGSCDISGEYEYRYEGIYVREYGKNYRLFEYTDMLRGDEEPQIIDLDADGDDDILYLVQGKLYFKENRKATSTPREVSHVTGNALTLQAKDNKFFAGNNVYHEAINYFEEANVSDGSINVHFQKPTNPILKNFRMFYHTVVDRYIDETNTDYIPQTVETHIVDAIADIGSLSPLLQTEVFSISPHLATLDDIGAFLPGVKLTTEKLGNIKDQLEQNSSVTLTSKTQVYAGNAGFTLTYTLSGTEKEESVVLAARQTISFKKPVRVVSLSGDAYVSLGIQEDIVGTDLASYRGKPLLPGAKIIVEGDKRELTESSHLGIKYYDTSRLDIDLRDVNSYTLYDLGAKKAQDYTIRLPVPNDFYYARIQAFNQNIGGTLSQQILLAPQKYADTLPPQIGLNQKIRIPVYQSQLVDLTPYIYEDGGFVGIEDVRIDFDLENDTDGDGDIKNDIDTQGIEIYKNPATIKIRFGPYDHLFEKRIMIMVEDDNGNIGTKEVGFEVYSPNPQIDAIDGNKITGQINETLLDEPVRLYRYRGGVIQKLQHADGTDVTATNDQGNYGFETVKTASGLTLTYSGSTVANIDEYTGRIDLEGALTTTRVLPSNSPENDSVYPEIQILQAGIPIFRQFVKIPEAEVQRVGDFSNLQHTGTYVKLLNQENFASYRVPLGVPINPGSVSIYLNNDIRKQAIMTVFQDGRIDINTTLYRLEYRTLRNEASLILVQKGSNIEVAQIVYHMEASYIVR